MEQLRSTIADLPWLGMIPVALAFLFGLVVWAAGRRVLKTGFGAAGLVTGVVAGLAASHVEIVSSTGVPPWVLAVVGAALLGLVAALLYRLVLAATIGVLLGGLVPLGVWAAVQLGWVPLEPGRPIPQSALASDAPATSAQGDELDKWLDDVLGASSAPLEDQAGASAEAPAKEAVASSATAWLEWLQRIADAAAAAPKAAWEQSPQPLRWTMVAAAAVGILLGLVLGAAAPTLSASAVTALGGSLLLLASAWVMAIKLGAGEGPWIPSSSIAFLGWWMVAAVIGLGVQWMIRPTRADKAA